ncbi:IscS subfamily cysteine desulfurase [Arcicella sp. LKC2W]|uniref:IscS subfamily cysteine desulfurase n=1 Tax=Arcicella sp. LKC2W TaxID=2984198 RepID=UPI002B1F32F1|nr:IscS subfamily cysteine desulfurase [Arcicella sp. LKC2W]MEA5458466.1 IscS subfamily cysteine desulfurase [Arcicella sp. LKC2W]
MKLPIYLDYNATTPVDKRVLEKILPYFTEHFGNAASRSHLFGWTAQEAVENAREQVADLIGAEVKEIVFTSGATEANNLAVKGLCELYSSSKNHIITVQTEHKAILDVCKHLEKLGCETTYLQPDSRGGISLEQIENAIRPETFLISVMYANNEIGTIQPIKEIGALARKNDILFHTDATQAVGKVEIDVVADNIDLLSLSGHKLYAPKGIGALYIRKKSKASQLIAQIDGGRHERGFRSGTLNVTGIVGLGEACEIAKYELLAENQKISILRDKLEQGILQNIDDVQVNGNVENRLPNLTNISFGGVDGENLLMSFRDIAVSSGSACTSATVEPSYVLKAIGLDDNLAYATIRFSLGKYTTEEEIDFTIKYVKEVVESLR